MRCEYCRIRNSNLTKPELKPNEWKEVFEILKSLNVEFNLILGNEPLLLGDGFVDIVDYMNKHNHPYATYTTFPQPLWQNYREKLLNVGIKNLSCGVDMLHFVDAPSLDVYLKSIRGIEALSWSKNQGVPDYQGTITVNKKNLPQVVNIVEELSRRGIWSVLNVVHWAKDKYYDFFPTKEEIRDLVITEKEMPEFEKVVRTIQKGVQEGRYKMQNPPEFFDALIKHSVNLDWHCKNPLIYTVDADGSMRTCAYRQGPRSQKYSIFDLQNKEVLENFKEEWKVDRDECPGCLWSYWWMADFFKENDEQFGKEVFQKHASKYYGK